MIGYYRYWVILTYLSMISAVTGMVFALDGKTGIAIICLMISGICDMFDGPVARSKKDRTEEEKNYGIQIDSLADLVSFGVFPVVIGYTMGLTRWWHIIIMSVYVLAALIRLAYYNVTEIELQQKNASRTHYMGLPVTTAAAAIPLTYYICRFFEVEQMRTVFSILYAALSIAFLTRFRLPKIRLRYIAITCGILLIPIIIYLVMTASEWLP